MKKNSQSGFSLIELLMVVVIISVIAAIAIPSLQKARSAAQNAGALSMLRTVSTLQVQFFTNNNRFGRLDEINNTQNGNLGTFAGTALTRGRFSYEMSPNPSPSDAEIKDSYIVIGTRILDPGDQSYVISVSQSGEIVQILP